MPDDMIGGYIDRFRIDALLGEGNMGSVYQAYDTNLTRQVVLKVMHRQLANHESFQKRFVQEAQAAARLDHPSIVKIYSFDVDPSLYMVMEYVEGPSLGDYLKHQSQKGQPVSLDSVLRLVAQVADALGYAHAQGVIHRDIKPSNVLLKPLTRPDREGDPALRAVVTDFGLAKLLDGGMHTLTGTFMGTLSYMSPEQCLGRDLDGRSDIYSLGIVLYQLTTGQLPFNVKSPTDAIRMHVKEIPPAPRLVRPGLPEMVEQVIMQAIAKNPASRFQTGDQFASALRRVAHLLVNPAGTSATLPNGDILLRESSGGGSELVSAPSVDQLLIYHAGEAPRIVSMTQDSVTVGRGQENELVLPDKGVSRRHLRIERGHDGWTVTDLDSTNGTFLDKIRLSPQTPEAWQPETELRLGPYSLQWQQAIVPPPVVQVAQMPLIEREEEERPNQTSAGEVEIVVDPHGSVIEAGDAVNLQVMFVNRGPIVDHVSVRVDGLPTEWVSYSQQLVKLMPGSRGFIRVTVCPPRDSSARSGIHNFKIVATPMSNPDASVAAVCELNIKPFNDYSVYLNPRPILNKGRAEVRITNQGNAEGTYVISGDQSSEHVDFRPETVKVRARPGESQTGEIDISAVKRHWFGGSRRAPIEVDVWSKGAGARQVRTELEIRPRVPLWLMVVLLTLVIATAVFLTLWLTIPR